MAPEAKREKILSFTEGTIVQLRIQSMMPSTNIVLNSNNCYSNNVTATIVTATIVTATIVTATIVTASHF